MGKLDFINKHVGKKKFDGKWFMDPNCECAKNEIDYVYMSITIVVQQFNLNQAMENEKKVVQFVIVFCPLSKD
jgi:hypothetical protein